MNPHFWYWALPIACALAVLIIAVIFQWLRSPENAPDEFDGTELQRGHEHHE